MPPPHILIENMFSLLGLVDQSTQQNFEDTQQEPLGSGFLPRPSPASTDLREPHRPLLGPSHLPLAPRPHWPEIEPRDLAEAGPSRPTQPLDPESYTDFWDTSSLPSLEPLTPPDTPDNIQDLMDAQPMSPVSWTSSPPRSPQPTEPSDGAHNIPEGEEDHPDFVIEQIYHLSEEEWNRIPYNQNEVDDMLGIFEQEAAEHEEGYQPPEE